MRKKTDRQFFYEHIDELKGRLFQCLAVIAVSSCVFYVYIDEALDFIIRPVGQLVFTSPADAFMVRFNLTLLGGVLLSLPLIIYHLWQFVSCGLKEGERKYVLVFAPVSVLFFVLGAFFAYFVAIPFSVKFFLSYSSAALVPMITVNNYVSFAGTLILTFGVVFEMPLVLMFLTKIGVATPAFLEQKRKHAIVLILIVSAVITPPDVITQVIMAGPLVILYEISLWISRWTYCKHSLDKDDYVC